MDVVEDELTLSPDTLHMTPGVKAEFTFLPMQPLRCPVLIRKSMSLSQRYELPKWFISGIGSGLIDHCQAGMVAVIDTAYVTPQ
ncbi:hypothetical protein N7462_009329 [Penicillium macrosclerotiorum]|uniref:uncharacterized protein n=1 Tax=Penicillium macrosclerotiorum TaxID=303699 RepID=UPI0025490705|nr:uncharacterized protein N7462_009329 [Penicillium macrosclerotiorum]KAJ5673890.1 hypothetical protein N7462_009329 [Penicillium macrosclerotiorum]